MPDPVTDIDGYLAYLVLAGVLADGDGSRLQQRLVHREGIVIDLNAGCGLFGPLEARDPDTFSITAIHAAEVPAEQVVFVGLDQSSPAPGVVDAIAGADLVVLPPSNPVVSVGTILGVPGLRDAVRATEAKVVGLSPIVGATHVRGMAEQMLTSIGVEVSAAGVGLNYGARAAGGVLDGWLVDERDADQVARLEAAGIRAAAVPLMMTDHDATAAMAAAAIDLVR